jgi:hypothetical protein
MKSKQLLGLIVAVLAATASQGQEPEKAKDNQSTKSKSKASAQSGPSVRLSEVLGAKVSSDGDETLGEIKDVIVDGRDGKIQFVLLDTDFSDKLLPVPWQALKVSDADECTMQCKRQKLESAPTIEEDQYGTLQSPDYIIRVYEFYEIVPPSSVGVPGQERGVGSGKDRSQEEQKPPRFK